MPNNTPGWGAFLPRYNIPETFGAALSYEAQLHWFLENWDEVADYANALEQPTIDVSRVNVIDSNSALPDVRNIGTDIKASLEFDMPKIYTRFADPLDWDFDTAYDMLTVVRDGSGNSYTSRQAVPANTPLTNTDYWVMTGSYDAGMQEIREDLASVKDGYGRVYRTVADMQSDTEILPGMICHTLGFHAVGDGGSAWYVVGSGEANGMDVLQLATNDCAVLAVCGTVVPEMLGAYGNAVADDTAVIQYRMDRTGAYGMDVCLPRKYRCTADVTVPSINSIHLYGVEINKSGLFMDGCSLLVAQESAVNEFTMSLMTVRGSYSQERVCDIRNVTNLYLDRVNFFSVAPEGYLLDINNCEICYITKCIFSGSNSGAHPIEGHGIRCDTISTILLIDSANVWKLDKFLACSGSVGNTTLQNCWIECVNTTVDIDGGNGQSRYNNVKLVNNSVSLHNDTDQSITQDPAVRLVNVHDSTNLFNSVFAVEGNWIYIASELQVEPDSGGTRNHGLVTFSAITEYYAEVLWRRNVMTGLRLDQIGYAAYLDSTDNNFFIDFSGTTNAEVAVACNISTAKKENSTLNNARFRQIILNRIPANNLQGLLYYQDGNFYYQDASGTKTIPHKNTTTFETATSENAHTVLNDLIAALKVANVV